MSEHNLRESYPHLPQALCAFNNSPSCSYAFGWTRERALAKERFLRHTVSMRRVTPEYDSPENRAFLFDCGLADEDPREWTIGSGAFRYPGGPWVVQDQSAVERFGFETK